MKINYREMLYYSAKMLTNPGAIAFVFFISGDAFFVSGYATCYNKIKLRKMKTKMYHVETYSSDVEIDAAHVETYFHDVEIDASRVETHQAHVETNASRVETHHTHVASLF